MKLTLEQLENEAKQLNDKIEAFKKQLEQPKEKSYNWEESFKGKGFYLTDDSQILPEVECFNLKSHRNISATEKVIKSNLAACQLSHIIEAINKDFEVDSYCTIAYEGGYLDWIINQAWALPYLNSGLAAKKLIETNRPLLLQFFGVEEK